MASSDAHTQESACAAKMMVFSFMYSLGSNTSPFTVATSVTIPVFVSLLNFTVDFVYVTASYCVS